MVKVVQCSWLLLVMGVATPLISMEDIRCGFYLSSGVGYSKIAGSGFPLNADNKTDFAQMIEEEFEEEEKEAENEKVKEVNSLDVLDRAGLERLFFNYIIVNDYMGLEELLRYRPSLVEAVNKDGDTALFWAVKSQASESILRLLLTHGAQLQDIKGDGYTPVELAIKKNNRIALRVLFFGCVALARGTENQLKKILNRDPSSLFIVNENGDTVLHWAIKSGSSQSILELLLSYGAHLEIKNRDGFTPLTLAYNQRNFVAIDVLLKALRSEKGDACLDLACARGDCPAKELKFAACDESINEELEDKEE